MSFGEHLEELRTVFIKSLLSIAVGCVIGLLVANPVVNILTGPLVRAMTKYAQANAMDDLLQRNGYVDPELTPWLVQDKLIPKQSYVDPNSLVAALQTILPDFAKQIAVDPFRFDASQFPADEIKGLCQSLMNPSFREDGLVDRRMKIRSELTPQEQLDVLRIAEQAAATEQDSAIVADVFNRLTREKKIFEYVEFADDLAEPKPGWLSLLSAPKTNILAKMKSQYDAQPGPAMAKRLNRALLGKLFRDQMTELRLNLVPIEFWERADFQPQSLGVSETFMVWLKAGMLTGFTIAAPVVFYHLWSFVAAGLYPHEQRYVHIYLPMSLGLFVFGVLLAFIFVFDPVLDFLFSFNRQMGIAPQMRINDWLSFVMFMPLGFGTAFQLPLVMLFLNRIGIFQVADYISKWRISIMIIFVISMFLTPSDPISLLFLAIPLSFLYFLGVALCKWMPKNQNPFAEEEREYTAV
jgi:sec-independent protein translocase protein TatC